MICTGFEYIYKYGDNEYHRVVNFKSPKWEMYVYVNYYDDNDCLRWDDLFVSSHFSKDTLAREFWKQFPQLKKVSYTLIKHFSVDILKN